jgi:hypothetical protein
MTNGAAKRMATAKRKRPTAPRSPSIRDFSADPFKPSQVVRIKSRRSGTFQMLGMRESGIPKMDVRSIFLYGLNEQPFGSSIAINVIMSDAILPAIIDGHYPCCEMFPMEWSPAGSEGRYSDFGVLLEIWQAGGLVHSAVPIAQDSLIELGHEGRTIQARIASCEPYEQYGFLVRVTVNPRQYDNWLPEFYLPLYLQFLPVDYMGP